MALSSVSYLGDGVNKLFSVTFPYLAKAHVKVFVGGVVTTLFTWVTGSSISITTAPGNLVSVVIQRVTPTAPLVDFVDGSTLTESLLDTSSLQGLYVVEEGKDYSDNAMLLDASDNKYEANSKVIKNVAAPTATTDAVNKEYADATIPSSILNAANSATASANSATQAANSALSSANSALSSADSATASANSAIESAGYVVPSQVGQGGKVLKTNGTTVSWQDSNTRNILINAGFRINQRAYVSAAVLAAGAYGHDRFKAGASGGDYSFTQLNTNTQITIASGKSLIQVVEDKNVNDTDYVLSWEGTAQARVGVNSATPSGAYASSPILITGQTAGTTMSVEFNTGTLGKAQLEAGSIATPFETRPIGTELALCQRYYQKSNGDVGAERILFSADVTSGLTYYAAVRFPVTLRATPTLSVTSSAFAAGFPATAGTVTPSISGIQEARTATATATGGYYTSEWTATAEL